MDSIIFDLDGTLWDSTPIVADAWNEVIRKNYDKKAALTEKDLKALFGRTLPDIAAKLFTEVSKERQLEIIHLCCEKEHEALLKNSPSLYGGVEKTLAVLAEQFPLFIVSNCQAGYIELFLSLTKTVKYFKDHLCPGDTGQAKAFNIQEIIKRNGLKAPVYVGDTNGDYLAAKESGVPFVFASYGFDQVKEPDFEIKKPMDLLPLCGLC